MTPPERAMRGIRPKALLSIALLMPMPALRPIATPSIASIRIAPDLVVERPVFGVLVAGDDGVERFEPSSRVPLTQGQAYGWVMKLHTNRPSVRWRERLQIPDRAPNRSARAKNPRTPAAARREQTLEADGLIGHFWRVGPGDPGGSYAIEVYVEEALVQQFVFTLDASSRRASLTMNGV
jgi:hypothetical protein